MPKVDRLRAKGNRQGLIKLLLRTTTDPSIRMQAAKALGDLGGESVADALAEATKDTNPRIRCDAAAALAKLGDARAAEPLVDLLGAELDPSLMVKDATRKRAKTVLQQFGEPATQALISGLGHDSNIVRIESTDLLVSALGPHGAVDVLVAALDSDASPFVATALGRIGTPALDALQKALREGDQAQRAAAAKALGMVGNDAALPDLVAALGDDSNELRGAAATALGKIGNEKAVRSLKPLLKDSDRDVAFLAREALVALGAGPPKPIGLDAAVAVYLHSSDTLLTDIPSGDRLFEVARLSAQRQVDPPLALGFHAANSVKAVQAPGQMPLDEAEAQARKDKVKIVEQELGGGFDRRFFDYFTWVEELTPTVRVLWIGLAKR